MAIASFFLFEEEFSEIVNDLIRLRCLNEACDDWYWDFKDCPFKNNCKEAWHDLNNSELHFVNLRKKSSKSKQEISRKWLNYFINRNKQNKPIKFNILYLNLNNLDISKFGRRRAKSKWHENVYTRFFRSNIKYGLKFFSFGFKDKIEIKTIIHDNSTGLAFHKYFPKDNLRRLEDELKSELKKKVVFPTKIIFLDSDHKKASNEEERLDCQVLQLVDLVLGATTQSIFCPSEDPFKKELAWILRDLVERLLLNPANPNSSFNYHRRQNISFFPKHKLENAREIFSDVYGSKWVERRKGSFYKVQKLKLPPKLDQSQTSLANFFGF